MKTLYTLVTLVLFCTVYNLPARPTENDSSYDYEQEYEYEEAEDCGGLCGCCVGLTVGIITTPLLLLKMAAHTVSTTATVTGILVPGTGLLGCGIGAITGIALSSYRRNQQRNDEHAV
jgi:hypothetical protein